MIELVPILVPTLSFVAVAAVAFVLGQYFLTQAQMQRRLPAQPATGFPIEQPLHGFDAFVARHFNAGRFGVTEAAREKLRRKLQDAGYFGAQAVNYYAFAKVAA